MRDFYIYGFKGRDEFDSKSARIYDDEYRRVKAWLEGYIDSYYDENGKKVFISIDSRTLCGYHFVELTEKRGNRL